jgi:hypothetical protein
MWREWFIKTKACGGKRGWAKALMTDLTHSSVAEADLTVDQEKDQETNNDA